MESQTLRALEFDKITDLIKGYASSELGAAATPSLLNPGSSLPAIQTALKETTEFVGLVKAKGRLPLGGLGDFREDLRKTLSAGRVLEPELLLEVERLLKAVRDLKNYIGGDESLYPLLFRRSESLLPLAGLRADINRCIGEDGSILDSASPRLARLRKAIESQRANIKKALDDILSRRKEVVQDRLITVRNGRYVIPLRHDFGRVMEGIVHDKSHSGHTFFVEPAKTVELNNRLAALMGDEQSEIYRILQLLTEEVKAECEAIEANCHRLAELDFIHAKARFSIDFGCSEPIINDRNFIHLREARHPLLISRMRRCGGAGTEEEVVPLTISLGEGYNTLLISGPNTGGKTVALKTVGLLNLMAQAGCHIPAAEGSSVGMFREIFADIGDDQSIEQSLSTFSSHMKNIVQIVDKADESSLVLLDELGSGTEPSEGAALGIALLEHLNGKRVKTIATTHHDLLKTHVYTTEGMENGSFEFDTRSLSPTYRFLPGLPGGSNALEIAARLGLPESLRRRARMELGDSRLKVHQFISELKGDLKKLEEEREATVREKKRLQNLKDQYLKIIQTEREENEKARAELRRRVDEFVARSREEIKEALEEIKAGAAEKVSDAPAQKALTAIKNRSRELSLIKGESRAAAMELHKGDAVFIPSIGLRGTLLEEPSSSERVYVKCQDKTLHLPLTDLRKEKKREGVGAVKQGVTVNYELHTGDEDAPNSINIIGKTVDEALPLVDKALDKGFLRGLPSLTIIHGVGTGRLRDAVENLLAEHPLVKGFRTAAREEGGRGATVVEL
jgi:DNA mismatch repair protein MutS2